MASASTADLCRRSAANRSRSTSTVIPPARKSSSCAACRRGETRALSTPLSCSIFAARRAHDLYRYASRSWSTLVTLLWAQARSISSALTTKTSSPFPKRMYTQVSTANAGACRQLQGVVPGLGDDRGEDAEETGEPAGAIHAAGIIGGCLADLFPGGGVSLKRIGFSLFLVPHLLVESAGDHLVGHSLRDAELRQRLDLVGHELVAGGWMAADYAPDKIRNVVLLGHSHDGKTTLSEAMLFASGAIPRLGSPDQQTATMDFEPEEQRRKISINLGVGFAEHNGFKINILDAPGFFDFTGQVLSGLRAAEGAVVVVGPNDHLAVGTEIAWELCNRTSKPRIVVVNKLDKEHSDFYGAVTAMREHLSPRPFPLHLPIGSEQDFRGIVDLLHLKAFVTTSDGKGTEAPIPDDMQSLVDQYRGQLIEAAAESDDSLLEKYLEAGTLNEEEIQRGLREGILAGKVAPVVCSSATKLLGVRTLMSTLCELLPPAEGDPSQPTRAFVFSTGGDQFGKVSYFKVVSGSIKADQHLANLNRGGDERLAQIFFPRGKEHVSATEIKAGDIGAVTKLTHTLTGDTLGSKDGGPLPLLDLPAPAYGLAITPKARGDEEKISSGLARLAEE